MFKRNRKKAQKQSVIQNYQMAYLDKRSRSYHKIIMTSFIGIFGLAGAAYIFSSGAAGPSQNITHNPDLSYALIAVALLLAAAVLCLAIIAFVRRKHL